MESRPAPDAPDAAELVERIRSGDARAEAELVGRFGRGILLVLKRLVGDSSTANDLYQETFRLGLRKVRDGEVREPARVGGFLCALARNLAIEHFRRSARTETRPTEAFEPIPSPAPGALEGLLARERARLAREVLAGMRSERDRQVLRRFYLADEEKESICADLNLTPLQLHRILFRARERFRERWEALARDRWGRRK